MMTERIKLHMFVASILHENDKEISICVLILVGTGCWEHHIDRLPRRPLGLRSKACSNESVLPVMETNRNVFALMK